MLGTQVSLRSLAVILSIFILLFIPSFSYAGRPSKASIKSAKKIASKYWAGICNNGKDIKVVFYDGNLPKADPGNSGSTDDYFASYETLAYSYLDAAFEDSSNHCKVWFNETALNKAGFYSATSFCTILTHEVGHLNGNGHKKGKKNRANIMYPYYSFDQTPPKCKTDLKF